MPAVLRFNRPAIEGKIGRAAAYLGIAGGFDGFLGRVEELNDLFGMPKGLRAMGVEDARIPELAAQAIVDPTAGGNPVPLTQENTERLFNDAM
jgi:alcohol dehydrogenase class IV